jgi:hypothetical protein
MFKKRLTFSEVLLILVNFIPAIGVWYWGWDAKQVFLVYSCETIIIGLLNVVRMLIVTFTTTHDATNPTYNRKKIITMGLGITAFFVVHYGFFVYMQLSMFTSVARYNISGHGFLLGKIHQLLTPTSIQMLLLFAAVYSLQMLIEFVLKGAYKTMSITRVMFEPYIRIFVQQFVVIIGSALLMFGLGKGFIIVYVICIIIFSFLNIDLQISRAERIEKRRKKTQAINNKI